MTEKREMQIAWMVDNALDFMRHAATASGFDDWRDAGNPVEPKADPARLE